MPVTRTEKHNLRPAYIESDEPQQNAYIEHYNRTVRAERLRQLILEPIDEPQNQATEWLWTYKNEQPNLSIGGLTHATNLKSAG